jgi:hypothetical protein
VPARNGQKPNLALGSRRNGKLTIAGLDCGACGAFSSPPMSERSRRGRTHGLARRPAAPLARALSHARLATPLEPVQLLLFGGELAVRRRYPGCGALVPITRRCNRHGSGGPLPLVAER